MHVSDYGGIYLDLDTIVVKSFDDLRVHRMTVGYEHMQSNCNCILVVSPGAEFVDIWLREYRDDYRVSNQ